MPGHVDHGDVGWGELAQPEGVDRVLHVPAGRQWRHAMRVEGALPQARVAPPRLDGPHLLVNTAGERVGGVGIVADRNQDQRPPGATLRADIHPRPLPTRRAKGWQMTQSNDNGMSRHPLVVFLLPARPAVSERSR